MKPKFLFLTAALLSAGPVLGQIFFTETYTFTVGSTAGDIPDGVGSSVFSQLVNTSQIANLTGVQVGLNLTGNPAGQGWAGDLFVSLNSNLGGQTAVLLNQAGVAVSNPAGFGFDGWNVTFDDNAPNGDIHLGQPAGPATILTGAWQPDGRLSPTDTLRPALLNVFNGGTGNSTWYLDVADLSPGGTMTLNSWSLTLSGLSSIPEPAESSATVGLGLSLVALIHSRNKRHEMQRTGR